MRASVGIDPSLTSTGIVVLDLDYNQLLIESIITKPENGWKDRVRRIKEIHRILKDIIFHRLREVGIGIITLEDYSYSSRHQAHQLGELGFIFRRTLAEYFPDCTYVVPPKKIKKYITGKGNASKKKVAEVIEEKYNLKFPSLDLSDACACAIYGLEILSEEAKFIYRNDN